MTALTHSSYANEKGIANNERLEFLGDAVLQLVVTRHLFGEYANLQEGQMTRVRAAVVRKEALVGVAESLGVGDALRLGKGEAMSGGKKKAGILADAMEAVIGAVYQDGGWKSAERLVMNHWGNMIEEQAAAPDARDAKTQLQERLAAEGETPQYHKRELGPGNARSYRAEVRVRGRLEGVGKGRSGKSAEQRAAAAALEKLYPDEQSEELRAPVRVTAAAPDPPPLMGRLRRWSERRSGRKS